MVVRRIVVSVTLKLPTEQCKSRDRSDDGGGGVFLSGSNRGIVQRPCAKTGGTKSDAESVKVADSIGHGRSDQYRAVQYRGIQLRLGKVTRRRGLDRQTNPSTASGAALNTHNPNHHYNHITL